MYSSRENGRETPLYLVLGPLCKPLLVMELPNKRLLLLLLLLLLKGVGKLDSTSTRTTLSAGLGYPGCFTVVISVTYLFARDLAPRSIFFPGTGEETMVVDRRNHKPIALLCLAFGVVVQT